MSDSIDDYFPGYVLVKLKNTPEPCEENLAAMLGYKFLGYRHELAPNLFGDAVYEVPVGQEEEAIKRFEEQEFFVESAYRREKSFERICDYQGRLENVLEDMYYSVKGPEDVMSALRGFQKVLRECIDEEERVMEEARPNETRK